MTRSVPPSFRTRWVSGGGVDSVWRSDGESCMAAAGGPDGNADAVGTGIYLSGDGKNGQSWLRLARAERSGVLS